MLVCNANACVSIVNLFPTQSFTRSLSLSQSASVSLALSVGPPVFLVPQRGRQILAALVLSPHLAISQRWRGIARGARQRHV